MSEKSLERISYTNLRKCYVILPSISSPFDVRSFEKFVHKNVDEIDTRISWSVAQHLLNINNKTWL